MRSSILITLKMSCSQHGHSHEDQDHDHDHNEETAPAIQALIYEQIDFGNIRTLNESETESGAQVIRKTWAQRLDLRPELVSDADEQLLIFVPYVE